jgi:hypothetical protein
VGVVDYESLSDSLESLLSNSAASDGEEQKKAEVYMDLWHGVSDTCLNFCVLIAGASLYVDGVRRSTFHLYTWRECL